MSSLTCTIYHNGERKMVASGREEISIDHSALYMGVLILKRKSWYGELVVPTQANVIFEFLFLITLFDKK
jgi:hypothetical protein